MLCLNFKVVMLSSFASKGYANFSVKHSTEIAFQAEYPGEFTAIGLPSDDFTAVMVPIVQNELRNTNN